MSMLNLSEVLIEQIHEASEITVILRTASLATHCMSLLLLLVLRTNRPLWQNTMCGKKVVQSMKWE